MYAACAVEPWLISTSATPCKLHVHNWPTAQLLSGQAPPPVKQSAADTFIEGQRMDGPHKMRNDVNIPPGLAASEMRAALALGLAHGLRSSLEAAAVTLLMNAHQ
jgi:hypothetical protein